MERATSLDTWIEDAASAPSRRRAWWALVALLLLAAGAGAGYWQWRRRAPPPAPVALTWVAPQFRRLAASVTTTGTVRLRTGAEVRVGSQVSGIVSQLNVAVGSRIRQGDVIAGIDPRPLQSKLDEARAQVAVDRVAVAKAQRDLDRGRQLLADGLVPRQQGEDLAWQLQSAQAQLASARSLLAAAQLDLSYAVIRAPISGTVASVATQEGETVAAAFASPTFITIVQDRALELDALVDETDIGNVRPGDPVQFTVETFPDRMLRAVVRRVDPSAVLVSGVVNYSVVAEMARVPNFLRPDMTANITIATSTRQAWMVPDGAVRRDGDGAYVLVAGGGAPQRVAVGVGERAGGWTEVTSGLAAGAKVGLGPAPEAAAKGGA
ncbi:MAG TPA: efflux RND transporter periplasmic adaptor subunit [Terriglobales bacterium]|nr:efflux RND transporter periplasmic adaptor subunit [Terriglobales bacterium]